MWTQKMGSRHTSSTLRFALEGGMLFFEFSIMGSPFANFGFGAFFEYEKPSDGVSGGLLAKGSSTAVVAWCEVAGQGL